DPEQSATPASASATATGGFRTTDPAPADQPECAGGNPAEHIRQPEPGTDAKPGTGPESEPESEPESDTKSEPESDPGTGWRSARRIDPGAAGHHSGAFESAVFGLAAAA